jgi:uncharacterized membrane protein YjjP (DUF1212 family)
VNGVSLPSRHVGRKLLLGFVAGVISYLLLLWLRGPWEESIAAILIGSVVGVVDSSPTRILMGSAASLLAAPAGLKTHPHRAFESCEAILV